MPEYVIVFACPDGASEAILVTAPSPEAAARVRDGRGCPATRVRPLAEVRLRRDPWQKGGFLRVEIEERP